MIMSLWTELDIESLHCLNSAALLLWGEWMQENVDTKLLILVCRIDINTCSFVCYIMKITYCGLQDVGVILAGA